MMGGSQYWRRRHRPSWKEPRHRRTADWLIFRSWSPSSTSSVLWGCDWGSWAFGVKCSQRGSLGGRLGWSCCRQSIWPVPGWQQHCCEIIASCQAWTIILATALFCNDDAGGGCSSRSSNNRIISTSPMNCHVFLPRLYQFFKQTLGCFIRPVLKWSNRSRINPPRPSSLRQATYARRGLDLWSNIRIQPFWVTVQAIS